MSNQAKIRSKRHFVSIVAVLVSLLLFPAHTRPRTATAVTCAWWQSVVYYTDSSYSTSCGRTNYFCDGEVGHGGCFTSYTQVFYCDCEE
jgi:hypothetical protein